MGLASKTRSALTRSPRLYSAARRAAILGRYARKRVHEPDFEFFRGRGDGTGMLLDIGANAGQSALSFRAVNKGPILSIEPNPGHERDLKMVAGSSRTSSTGCAPWARSPAGRPSTSPSMGGSS